MARFGWPQTPMREAIIVEAIRSPVARRGQALQGVHPVDLLGQVFTELIRRTGLDPEQVDDVIVGCVDQVGEQSNNIARNAWLSAGLPESVPATTVDRQCGSSQQACHFAAQAVMAGVQDIIIAGGVESMTRVPLGANCLEGPGSPLTDNLRTRFRPSNGGWWNPAYGAEGWFNQAKAAEAVARQWNLTRQDLDSFSYQSHMRAAAARAEGRFLRETAPIRVAQSDGSNALFLEDEGIRTDTTLEKMSSLPSAFPGLTLITAGNSSQISDGASAAMITTMERAQQLGLRPRARFVAFSVVGVDPVTMLTGPIPATRKVLSRAGLELSDISLFEVNEAFASVPLGWRKKLGVSLDRVNVNGGAIALGHPLGATGTRILATLLHELERRQERFGLMTICEGAGLANGTIIERLSQ
jgi:acetyl-CoA acyltransferase